MCGHLQVWQYIAEEFYKTDYQCPKCLLGMFVVYPQLCDIRINCLMYCAQEMQFNWLPLLRMSWMMTKSILGFISITLHVDCI